ncbi:histidine kinase, partial [Vibrio vulnificus]
EGARLEPLSAWLNPEDITTILGNLIDNAFDATMSAIAQEGNFSRSRRTIEVSISDYGTEVILEVQDQGCGLPTQFSTEQLLEK